VSARKRRALLLIAGCGIVGVALYVAAASGLQLAFDDLLGSMLPHWKADH